MVGEVLPEGLLGLEHDFRTAFAEYERCMAAAGFAVDSVGFDERGWATWSAHCLNGDTAGMEAIYDQVLRSAEVAFARATLTTESVPD